MRLVSKSNLIISLLGIALFVPFLGAVHLFDWDEINFAECAREMLVLHDYNRVYINFQPFWEKPPLFIWMQAFSMNLFGVNEFSARFPNALCGVITLLVVYNIGHKIISHQFGVFWAMAFAGSFFPNLYFKSGIIDPFFNLFIFLSLYHFILYSWKNTGVNPDKTPRSSSYYIICSGIFIGLAMMMKGPAALLILGLTAGSYWIFYNRFRVFWKWGHLFLFLGITLLVSCSWYGYEIWKHGTWFLEEFITYQIRLFTTHDAGQKGFFGYHYVVLLFGCFPASVLAIAAFFRNKLNLEEEKHFKGWMITLFWVVTILFTIVQSRIIHYSSMAWFAVTFLAAYTMYNLFTQSYYWQKFMQVILIATGVLIGSALAIFPFIAKNAHVLSPYIKDEFAKANLAAEVNWTGWEPLIGILFLVFIFAGLFQVNKGNIKTAAIAWFGGTALIVFLASYIIVPRVERFSQGAAIDFMKEKANENCYIEVVGYKSYAHLFYGNRLKPLTDSTYFKDRLITGDIDKPVYLISKIGRSEYYMQFAGVKELYRKNGFVFMRRDPVTQ